VIGCSRSTPTASDPSPAHDSAGANASSQPIAISVQLNWFPEVEHGGVYQSLVDGTYAGAGLEVDIRPGGSKTPIAAELVLGRSQFAIANADDVVLFRAQGAKIVAVLATAQNHPRCILVRADSGVQSFQDLAGMTLQRDPSRPFLQFLRKQGVLENVREVPYFNSIAAMLNDPKIAIQAYSVAEPLLAQQQGMEVRTLMVSELGWNPYSSVLVTTDDLVEKSPELVGRMVTATAQGWASYFENPNNANAAILEANKHGMTADALQFGAEQMKPLAMPNGDSGVLGQMTEDRWAQLVSQMIDLELIDQDVVSANDCFTTQFLPIQTSTEQ